MQHRALGRVGLNCDQLPVPRLYWSLTRVAFGRSAWLQVRREPGLIMMFGGCTSSYATVAYDAASGAELWVARYEVPGSYAYALGVSPDGSTVFVTGHSYVSGPDWDYATVAYDAATGSELWVARFGEPGIDDHAYALRVSPDGSTVFVTGNGGYPADYATVAYDAATGAQVWVSLYNGPGKFNSDFADALGVSPDGSTVFVTGHSQGLRSSHFATVTYDAATGAQRWASIYDSPGNNDDVANALGVSPDGSMVFVTGYVVSRGRFNYETVAYDAATGAPAWASRYDGAEQDRANALGVSPDGSTVFVTGESYDSSGPVGGYATLAYDAATGTEQWVARDGRTFSVAHALGVSPDGSTVFVTGSSLAPQRDAPSGGNAHYLFATIAYEA